MIGLVLATLLASAVSAADPAAADDHAAVESVAREYVEAQFAFNSARLDAITAPAFVEVSPKGEVDERAAVLGFYDPSKATPAPPFTLDEVVVRISGDTAVVTQRLTLGTPPRAMVLTQLLTATRTAEGWRLTSSQSTRWPAATP